MQTYKLNISNYTELVEELVKGYFEGDYGFQPHWGRVNSMLLFYNKFVAPLKDTSSLSDMDEVLSNDDFIGEYHEALCDKEGLTFGAAMKDALSIVEDKKTLSSRIENVFLTTVDKVLEKIEPVMTEENISALSKICEAMGNTDDWAGALVTAYKNGDLASIQEEMSAKSSKNVLPFNDKK